MSDKKLHKTKKTTENNGIQYFAVDSNNEAIVIAEGNLKHVMNEIDKSGKDCIIGPKLEEHVTYIF